MTNQFAYHPFFVYGTLIPGEPNDHHWQGSITSAEPAVLENAQLYDLGTFPMLVETNLAGDAQKTSEKHVIGRLISVPETSFQAVIEALDRLEDYHPDDESSSIYLRVLREVLTHDWRRVPAWVYTGRWSTAKPYPIIPEGDWLAYCQREKQGGNIATWWQKNGLDLFFGNFPNSD